MSNYYMSRVWEYKYELSYWVAQNRVHNRAYYIRERCEERDTNNVI